MKKTLKRILSVVVMLLLIAYMALADVRTKQLDQVRNRQLCLVEELCKTKNE